MDFAHIRELIDKYRPTPNGYCSLPFIVAVGGTPHICWFNYYLTGERVDDCDIRILDVFVLSNSGPVFGCRMSKTVLSNASDFRLRTVDDTAYYTKLAQIYQDFTEQRMNCLLTIAECEPMLNAYITAMNFIKEGAKT